MKHQNGAVRDLQVPALPAVATSRYTPDVNDLRERWHRRGRTVVVLVGLAFGLMACSGFSLMGGVAGGLLTVLAAVLWLATATTQTSCTVQSCLSLLEPDSGESEDVGPCLSFIAPDAGDVGPCLGAPLPDLGVDAGEDAGEDGGIIGPCLSQPPPDAEVEVDLGVPDQGGLELGQRGPARERPDRRVVIEKLASRGVLSPDLARRLKGEEDGEAS